MTGMCHRIRCRPPHGRAGAGPERRGDLRGRGSDRHDRGGDPRRDAVLARARPRRVPDRRADLAVRRAGVAQLLFLLAPIGVALIAQTMATSPGTGDAAIFYAWPGAVGRLLLRHAPDRVHRAGDRARPRRRAAHHVRRHDRPLVRRRRSRPRSSAPSCGRWRRATSGSSRGSPRESRIDPLTGLLNRRGLAGALRRRGRARGPRGAPAGGRGDRRRPLQAHQRRPRPSDAGDRALAWLAAVLCEQTRGVGRRSPAPAARSSSSCCRAPTSRAPRSSRSACAARSPTEEAPIALTISAGVAARGTSPPRRYALTPGRRRRALRGQARRPRPRRLRGLNEPVDEGELLDHGRREHERVEVGLAEAAVDRVQRVGQREPGVEQRAEVAVPEAAG